MSRKLLALRLSMLIALVFLLTNCAATLAPSYDKALVDGLTATDTVVMRFFASVYSGTKKETFNQRKEAYSNLIGRFDALVIQAKARPVPKDKTIKRANDILSKRGIPIPNDFKTPSETALARISKTLAKMRDTDKKQGLTATEVQAFKNQVSIYLDQALTYENFLKR